MAFRRLLLTAAVALVCTAGVAKADPITLNLSSISSDATDPALLLASFTFTVTSSTTLTIEVRNDTSGPNSFDMSAIYFNFTNAVAGLGLTAVTDDSDTSVLGVWGYAAPAQGNPIDSMGSFGASVITPNNSASVIRPGETFTFTFTFTDNNAVTEADFAGVTSAPQNQNTPLTFIAAKFIHGPDDPEKPGTEDSAFGGFVPLPPALPMGIAGLIGVAFLRRRTLKK